MTHGPKLHVVWVLFKVSVAMRRSRSHHDLTKDVICLFRDDSRTHCHPIVTTSSQACFETATCIRIKHLRTYVRLYYRGVLLGHVCVARIILAAICGLKPVYYIDTSLGCYVQTNINF